jgi:hypothetical protein
MSGGPENKGDEEKANLNIGILGVKVPYAVLVKLAQPIIRNPWKCVILAVSIAVIGLTVRFGQLPQSISLPFGMKLLTNDHLGIAELSPGAPKELLPMAPTELESLAHNVEEAGKKRQNIHNRINNLLCWR